MELTDRLDPELAAAVKNFPADALDMSNLKTMRALMNGYIDVARMREDMPASIDNRVIPGPPDNPALTVRLYRPHRLKKNAAALLWIHGGGYVMGSCDMSDQSQADMAVLGTCLIVSVEYRLAPEAPFPRPLEDCYAALKWLHANAIELGIDAKRLAVGGASAGGGLAAALALLARDRNEVPLFWQLLLYPMLDDRNVTPSSHRLTDSRLWNRNMNLQGWRAYLGSEPGGDDVSHYAAAARASDLSGLPPAFIVVGECDLFCDENIIYAQRLMQAGVSTELHIYPGVFHGAEGMVPQAKISQRMQRDIDQAVQRNLA